MDSTESQPSFGNRCFDMTAKQMTSNFSHIKHIIKLLDNPSSQENTLQDVIKQLESKDRDLNMAASIGQALLSDNMRLNAEKNQLLEEFQQKIHALEAEKSALKVRLTNVETDYETHIKELQTDIVNLRIDVHKQKSLHKEIEAKRQTKMSELVRENKTMSTELEQSAKDQSRLEQELESVKVECSKRKILLHDHFQQLDTLRKEIGQLRSEKSHLEGQLTILTHERDEMVDKLSDAYQHMHLLEDRSKNQLATITSQDSQIAQLEAKADSLKEQIDSLTLSSAVNRSDSPAIPVVVEGQPSPRPCSASTSGGRSLLAELAEQRIELLNNRGFSLLQTPFSDRQLSNWLDENDVELDDASLLALAKGGDNEVELSSALSPPPPSIGNDIDLDQDATSILVDDLQSEVGEIYQQMRQMCIELTALGGGPSERSGQNNKVQNQRGTTTPDELAMVEMDFRLSSLRSVLGDLRGLLKELVADEHQQDVSSAENCLSQQQIVESTTVLGGANPASCDEMMLERNTLAAEVATAKQRVTQLRQQIESGSKLVSGQSSSSGGEVNPLNFVANWEDLEDDDYEFEMPR